MNEEKRFNESYVVDESGCWLWQKKSRTGSTGKYGRFSVNGKSTPAHRYSWELHNGSEIPTGMLIMHICDNPICVNPEHLLLGTHQDNMDDMVAKGRQAKGDSFKDRKSAKGSKQFNSKLTEQQAISIFNDNRPQRVIASEYKISQTIVHNIKSMKTWRHIHDSILK